MQIPIWVVGSMVALVLGCHNILFWSSILNAVTIKIYDHMTTNDQSDATYTVDLSRQPNHSLFSVFKVSLLKSTFMASTIWDFLIIGLQKARIGPVLYLHIHKILIIFLYHEALMRFPNFQLPSGPGISPLCGPFSVKQYSYLIMYQLMMCPCYLLKCTCVLLIITVNFPAIRITLARSISSTHLL